MHVDLPSGHYAEFRDTMLRGDMRRARQGIQFVINADGSRVMGGSFLDEVTGRLITQMLTGWNLDLPLPRTAATDDLQQGILDGIEEADYGALEKAVGPWVEKLLNRERPPQFKHKPTGILVEPVNAGDGAKLAQLGDFEAVADETAPKPASPPTAITSSASPAASG